MEVTRKELLASGAALALVAGCGGGKKPAAAAAPATGWAAVRAQFALDPRDRHFDAFLFAPHPKPVRAAIETHRKGLDAGAAAYLHAHEARARRRGERRGAGLPRRDAGHARVRRLDDDGAGDGLLGAEAQARRRGPDHRARPLRDPRVAAAERRDGAQGPALRRPGAGHGGRHDRRHQERDHRPHEGARGHVGALGQRREAADPQARRGAREQPAAAGRRRCARARRRARPDRHRRSATCSSPGRTSGSAGRAARA